MKKVQPLPHALKDFRAPELSPCQISHAYKNSNIPAKGGKTLSARTSTLLRVRAGQFQSMWHCGRRRKKTHCLMAYDVKSVLFLGIHREFGNYGEAFRAKNQEYLPGLISFDIMSSHSNCIHFVLAWQN